MIASAGNQRIDQPLGQQAVALIGRDTCGRLDDPILRARIAEFETDEAAFRALTEQANAAANARMTHPAFPSALKYYGAELLKRRHELFMSAGGTQALEWESAASDHGAQARNWLRPRPARSVEAPAKSSSISLPNEFWICRVAEMTNQTMEDQDILRDSARRFFGENAPVSQLRQLRDKRDETGFSTALWSEFGNMGCCGIMVAEEFGGSGLGVREAALLMEQMGHTLCVAPFLASSIVAVTALQHAGSADQKARWLPLLAQGSVIATLGLDEDRKHRPEHIDARAVRDGEGWRLNGTKCFVLDGHVANLLIVAARTSGASRDACGVTLFLVPRETAGVQVERTLMVDSHNAARVHFDNVQLPSDALLGPIDGASGALNATLNAARAAGAAELLGIAEEVFQRTIAYLKDRRQFYRRIGEFQALQHRAAKLYIDIELSRAALHDALCQLESASGTAASRAVAVAKAKCGNTATLAVKKGIQMHGGMGMTEACEIGFFVKRARVLQELFGDADHHMSRIACLDGY